MAHDINKMVFVGEAAGFYEAVERQVFTTAGTPGPVGIRGDDSPIRRCSPW